MQLPRRLLTWSRTLSLAGQQMPRTGSCFLTSNDV